MDFYPKHNRIMFQDLVSAQKKGSLIPFIGAGMSVFCGYRQWGTVLQELADYIPEETQKAIALQLLKNWEYTKAAQSILEGYPCMLDVLPEYISPRLIFDCPKERLEASAAFLLPKLFSKGLVTTTNFDRVIEQVYLQSTKEPIPVVTPAQPDRLTQLQQNESLALFKLHGDIGSEAVSYHDLVFTEDQYNEKYADGSQLVGALTTAFSTKRLLFLGCSLAMDRTMEVLKAVTKAQPHIRHFAIVGCTKEDRGKRLHELSNLGILPIFYDCANHDAVRVLLERLLEETNQEAYQKMYQAKPRVVQNFKEERRLLYDGEFFPFTGRKEEWQQLESFCNDSETISWWAVTGPGGMGKSRLVYEFAKHKQCSGWQVIHFAASPSRNSVVNSLRNLCVWEPGIEPTLVVLDDVQAYMNSITKWLQRIVHSRRSEKLRILLLEREGSGVLDAAWLENCIETDIPADWCYEENFLKLKRMSDPELMEIMVAFATASEKQLNAELLLKTLERVDPRLKRPLYAIAIADAQCHGKDPTNWDRTQVLDVLLKRELDFHISRLSGIIGKKPSKTLQREFQNFLAHSCVGLGIILDELDMSKYPNLANQMQVANMDAKEFFESIGILHTAVATVQKVEEENGIRTVLEERKSELLYLSLSCPDLIKEHFVLHLSVNTKENTLILPPEWEDNPMQLQFLLRLLVDYSEQLLESIDWNTVFQAKPKNVLCAKLFGSFLLGCSIFYSNKGQQIINCLKVLCQEHCGDDDFAIFYANALVNTMLEQDLNGCTNIIEELEKLFYTNQDSEEMTILYARGLCNLLDEQELDGYAETFCKLEKLYNSHQSSEEVIIQYAHGLATLMSVQELQECRDTIASLEQLYSSHKDMDAVVISYADGLADIVDLQDWPDCADAFNKLGQLYDDNLSLNDVAISYAEGMVNLSFKQDLKSCEITLDRMKWVQAQHPEDLEITLLCAMTWFNLTLHQEETDIPATVSDIRGFLCTHQKTVPEFLEKLDNYLTEHPEHINRYRPLQEIMQPV